MSCCPPGSAPYLAAEHTDEGKVGEIDGVSYYQVGSGEAGLLFLPDIWGWNGGRTRALCDNFAKKGMSVWVPKTLPPFEGGTDGDALNPQFSPVERGSELGPLFKGDWNPSKVLPQLHKVIGAMKAAGVKRIAVIGICYGAWNGMHLAAECDDIVCAASAHPSIHIEGMMGGDPAALAAKSKCPWALFPCGEIGGPGSDPDMYDHDGPLFKALEVNFPRQNECKRFAKSIHGFLTRGSIKPDQFNAGSGDDVKAAVQECVGDITNFFARNGLLKPKLYYFPLAGRGELIRLIAAVGGVELTETAEAPADKAVFGSPSGLPLLEHGELRMSQSTAIENYIASISPKYRTLTPGQVAVDKMFQCIKEDVGQGFLPLIFDPEKKKTAPEEVPKVCDKWFPVIEARLPADGFVHGLDFPTAADLVTVVIAKAYVPGGAAFKAAGGYDIAAKYKKLAAHANRVAAYPAVKDYLGKSASMAGNPMGL